MTRPRKRPRPHTKRDWSTADIRYIKDHWRQQSDAELAAHFGVSKDALQLFRWRVCKIKRPPNKTHLKHAFRPGNRPWNADRKGKPFRSVSPSGQEVWKVVLHGANGTRRCVTLARAVWEAAGHPVPKGHFVVQLAGDRANPQLADLVCVDRKGLGRIGNRMIATPRPVARAKGAETMRLKRKLRAYLGGPAYALGR